MSKITVQKLQGDDAYVSYIVAFVILVVTAWIFKYLNERFAGVILSLLFVLLIRMGTFRLASKDKFMSNNPDSNGIVIGKLLMPYDHSETDELIYDVCIHNYTTMQIAVIYCVYRYLCSQYTYHSLITVSMERLMY